MATDRLRTSPLDTEHLDETAMLPERVRELMVGGHTVTVVGRHLVVNDKPDDDSSGYLVVEIETTVEPAANAETVTLMVCHRAHAHHRVFNWDRVGGPEGATPSDDKHVERVLRSEKRARDVDDDQDTLVPDGGRVLDDEEREAEAWGHVGRSAVVDRITRDQAAVVETFEAVAAKIRRGESLSEDDVESARRAVEEAEYMLDDILEPIARGDVPERVHAVEEFCK